MEFSHCCNAYFRWSVETRLSGRRKVLEANDPKAFHPNKAIWP